MAQVVQKLCLAIYGGKNLEKYPAKFFGF